MTAIKNSWTHGLKVAATAIPIVLAALAGVGFALDSLYQPKAQAIEVHAEQAVVLEAHISDYRVHESMAKARFREADDVQQTLKKMDQRLVKLMVRLGVDP